NIDTGTRGPSERGTRQRRKTCARSPNGHGQIVSRVDQGAARGHIRHEPVKGQPDTSPSRCKRSNLDGFAGGAGRRAVTDDCGSALLSRPLSVKLGSEDDPSGLPIETDLTSSNAAARTA